MDNLCFLERRNTIKKRNASKELAKVQLDDLQQKQPKQWTIYTKKIDTTSTKQQKYVRTRQSITTMKSKNLTPKTTSII